MDPGTFIEPRNHLDYGLQTPVAERFTCPEKKPLTILIWPVRAISTEW